MTSSPLPAHLAARLDFAIALARPCGALAVKEAAQLQISAKGAHDVLTPADLAVEQLIRAEVARTSGVVRVPQSGVVAVFNGATRTISVTVTGVQSDLGLLDAVQVEV